MFTVYTFLLCNRRSLLCFGIATQHKSGEHLVQNVCVCKHSHLRFCLHKLTMDVTKTRPICWRLLLKAGQDQWLKLLSFFQLIKEGLIFFSQSLCLWILCVVLWNELIEWPWCQQHVINTNSTRQSKENKFVFLLVEITFLLHSDRRMSFRRHYDHCEINLGQYIVNNLLS